MNPITTTVLAGLGLVIICPAFLSLHPAGEKGVSVLVALSRDGGHYSVVGLIRRYKL